MDRALHFLHKGPTNVAPPPKDWEVAEAISEIGYLNPFTPERLALEMRALDLRGVDSVPFLHYRPDTSISDMFPNVSRLRERSNLLLERVRKKLVDGAKATARELETYESLALYQLYARYMSTVVDVPVMRFRARPADDILECYESFATDFRWFLELPRITLPSQLECDTVFAGLFQIERAFFHIFRNIVGSSPAAVKLRSNVGSRFSPMICGATCELYIATWRTSQL